MRLDPEHTHILNHTERDTYSRNFAFLVYCLHSPRETNLHKVIVRLERELQKATRRTSHARFN